MPSLEELLFKRSPEVNKFLPQYTGPSLEDWTSQVAGIKDYNSAALLYRSAFGSPSPTQGARRFFNEKLVPRELQDQYRSVIEANPIYQDWREWQRQNSSGGGGGFLHNLGKGVKKFVTKAPGAVLGGAYDYGQWLKSREGRKAIAIIGSMAVGGYAAGGGFGGAGAAAGTGAGAGAGFGGTAGGTGLGGIGGLGGVGGKLALGGGYKLSSKLRGGGGGGGGMNTGGQAGWIDPFLQGGGLSDTGGSGDSWYDTGWGKGLIKGGVSLLANKFLGDKTTEESQLSKLSRAPYESSEIQRFLPPELRAGAVGPMLQSGMGGIAELLRNPGGLSPTVSDAIRQRLAAESESIAQNYRGIGSQQAGAAARGNLPVSIKGALQSALDVAQERAQRGSRREALQDSDTLRRQDLEQTYKILDAILQFISSGRGQAIPGLSTSAQLSGNRQAAQLAAIGNLLSSGASQGG